MYGAFQPAQGGQQLRLLSACPRNSTQDWQTGLTCAGELDSRPRVQPASRTCEKVGAGAGLRARPDPAMQGAVAQLGERLICNQEVVGSIPISSTSDRACSSGG